MPEPKDAVVVKEIKCLFGDISPLPLKETKEHVEAALKLVEQLAKNAIEYDSVRNRGVSIITQLDSAIRKESESVSVSDDVVNEIHESIQVFYENAVPGNTQLWSRVASLEVKYGVGYSRGYYIGLAGLSNPGVNGIAEGDRQQYIHGNCKGASDRALLMVERSKGDYLGEDRVESVRQRIGVLRQEATAISNTIGQATESLSGMLEEKDAIRDGVSSCHEKLKSLEASISSTEKNIRQQIESSLKLSKPREYWSDRISDCRTETRIASSVFYALCLLSVFLFYHLSMAILGMKNESDNGVLSTISSSVSDLQVWERTLAFSVPVAIAIWILRILARNMISKKHMYEDARHRLTLLETYLSLLGPV